MLDVRDFGAADHAWARELLRNQATGDHRVTRRGELLDPLEHEGIVAELDGRAVGLLTVAESTRELEVLTLNSAERGIGVGTRLLETALRVGSASGSERLWLVTGNDNLDGIRWCLRRGLRVVAAHADAADSDGTRTDARPAATGRAGGPAADLVELEHDFSTGDALHFLAFPRIGDIDALPAAAAAHVMAPLFEAAPRFLERLAAERPFGDDVTLIRAAHDLARTLPEDEQIELLDAHPRIGADPASVSSLSHAEQGYGDGALSGEPWIADELEALNDAYERIFGFRFVIFVAGRPRSAIVPILEASLRDERISELRRGLDDVVHIAADRLRTLRG